MQACSLKFCTAIERPAPIRLWPRCCSSAFIGTTRKPPIAPSRIRNGAATQTLRDEVQADDQHAHRDAQRNDAGGVFQPHRASTPRRRRPRCRSPPRRPATRPASCCSPARPRPRPARCTRRLPADAPEQRGGGQRDLAQLVAPQARVAVRRSRAPAPAGCRGSGCNGALGARDVQVEHRGDRRRAPRSIAIAASGGVSMPVSMNGKSKRQQHGATRLAHQLPAEQDAQDDRGDGQALDPAVGLDQLRRRQQLGEDAVLGRRVGRGAQPDDRVRPAAGGAPNSIIRQPTTLMRVGDEHHRPLGTASAKAPTSGASSHVEQREHRHQRRHAATPARRWSCSNSTAATNKRVVGQRAEELRRHDGVETSFHALRVCGASVGHGGVRVDSGSARGVAAAGYSIGAVRMRGIVLPRVSRLQQCTGPCRARSKP